MSPTSATYGVVTTIKQVTFGQIELQVIIVTGQKLLNFHDLILEWLQSVMPHVTCYQQHDTGLYRFHFTNVNDIIFLLPVD